MADVDYGYIIGLADRVAEAARPCFNAGDSDFVDAGEWFCAIDDPDGRGARKLGAPNRFSR